MDLRKLNIRKIKWTTSPEEGKNISKKLCKRIFQNFVFHALKLILLAYSENKLIDNNIDNFQKVNKNISKKLQPHWKRFITSLKYRKDIKFLIAILNNAKPFITKDHFFHTRDYKELIKIIQFLFTSNTPDINIRDILKTLNLSYENTKFIYDDINKKICIS